MAFESRLTLQSRLEGHYRSEHQGGIALAQAADRVPGELREVFRTHSADELRHSQMFATLLRQDFGRECPPLDGQLPGRYLDLLHQLDDGGLTAFIAEIHAAELRSAVLLRQWTHVASQYLPEELATRVVALFKAIQPDEDRHLDYTLAYLNRGGFGPETTAAIRGAIAASDADSSEHGRLS